MSLIAASLDGVLLEHERQNIVIGVYNFPLMPSLSTA